MSIYSALRSGVSALTANSSAMAVISDNIANVNTVGFKGAKTDFISLLNDQSSGSHYNPGGVIADTRRLVNTQGTIQSTSSSTDLAISGNGFFVVSRDNLPASIGDGVAFTRAGSFSLDRSGYLANGEGFYLQGWPMQDDGTFLTSPTSLSTLEAISIANVTATAEATQNVSVRANLASDEEDYDGVEGAYAVGAMAGNTITPDFESSIEVYDSLGAARTLNL